MCGICGTIYHEPERYVTPDELDTMSSLLRHRGPDDAGSYCAGNVGLGHRRLSIIDLSPAGHQPMSNEDESIWIVFNGEIYNYPDIRTELLGRGHSFRQSARESGWCSAPQGHNDLASPCVDCHSARGHNWCRLAAAWQEGCA